MHRKDYYMYNVGDDASASSSISSAGSSISSTSLGPAAGGTIFESRIGQEVSSPIGKDVTCCIVDFPGTAKEPGSLVEASAQSLDGSECWPGAVKDDTVAASGLWDDSLQKHVIQEMQAKPRRFDSTKVIRRSRSADCDRLSLLLRGEDASSPLGKDITCCIVDSAGTAREPSSLVEASAQSLDGSEWWLREMKDGTVAASGLWDDSLQKHVILDKQPKLRRFNRNNSTKAKRRSMSADCDRLSLLLQGEKKSGESFDEPILARLSVLEQKKRRPSLDGPICDGLPVPGERERRPSFDVGTILDLFDKKSNYLKDRQRGDEAMNPHGAENFHASALLWGSKKELSYSHSDNYDGNKEENQPHFDGDANHPRVDEEENHLHPGMVLEGNLKDHSGGCSRMTTQVSVDAFPSRRRRRRRRSSHSIDSGHFSETVKTDAAGPCSGGDTLQKHPSGVLRRRSSSAVSVESTDDDGRSISSTGVLQGLFKELNKKTAGDDFHDMSPEGGGGDGGDKHGNCGKSDGLSVRSLEMFCPNLEDELRAADRGRARESNGESQKNLGASSTCNSPRPEIRRGPSFASLSSVLGFFDDVKVDLQDELLDRDGAMDYTKPICSSPSKTSEETNGEPPRLPVSDSFYLPLRKPGRTAPPAQKTSSFDLAAELKSEPAPSSKEQKCIKQFDKEDPSLAEGLTSSVGRRAKLVRMNSLDAIMNMLPSLGDEVSAAPIVSS